MNSNQSPFEQVCAIPYRRKNKALEFCIVTSTNGRWLFPKGFIDTGETVKQAALKEAGEEAGVQGRIQGKPLGCFQYEKFGMTLNVTVVLMKVTQCNDQWEEADKRERRWVSAKKAIHLLSQKELCDLVPIACQRIKSLATN